jgi:hypothetical protein
MTNPLDKISEMCYYVSIQSKGQMLKGLDKISEICYTVNMKR